MTQIHQVKGRDLVDALERAREEIGEAAVVLSRRTVAGGVALALCEEEPRTKDELGRLRDRANAVLAHSPEAARAPKPRVSTDEVENRMSRAGASQRLTDRVVEAVAGRAQEGRHPLDLAGEELSSVVPVASSKMAQDEVTILAFLGQPGSGKTTTAAKLALRLRMAGRRVALVTTDTHRVGSVEQAKALGRHIGCPAIAMQNPARLAAALAGSSPRPDVVLLDTTGRPQSDGSSLDMLQSALDDAEVNAKLERYLVLPANSRDEALEEAATATHYDGCVITRLDETARPGPVVELAMKRRLPIAFLCDGSDLNEGLHRAEGSRFADLFLRGRIV